MNPIQEITNEYIKEIKFNAKVILDAIGLGHPPQMIRSPSHHVYDEDPLLTDGTFPNNFVIPEPCDKCYTFVCDGLCSQENVIVSQKLSFEEEMGVPPPPALTRIHTNAHLPDDEPEDEDEDVDK
jgi:hypothetical protein